MAISLHKNDNADTDGESMTLFHLYINNHHIVTALLYAGYVIRAAEEKWRMDIMKLNLTQPQVANLKSTGKVTLVVPLRRQFATSIWNNNAHVVVIVSDDGDHCCVWKRATDGKHYIVDSEPLKFPIGSIVLGREAWNRTGGGQVKILYWYRADRELKNRVQTWKSAQCQPVESIRWELTVVKNEVKLVDGKYAEVVEIEVVETTRRERHA